MSDRGGREEQHLGNYRLTRLLDKGGFAEVYLGEHVYLNTQAAIKILHTRLTSEAMGDFLKEARNLSHLVHPHIIRVLDFGVQDTTPFLVMDYAPHGSLRQRHPKGTPVPLSDIVLYVGHIAAALQHAHDQKLIHRDIKPENMLLGPNNEVLLSDFGIALLIPDSASLHVPEMIGAMAYMAPEQVRGSLFRQATSTRWALSCMNGCAANVLFPVRCPSCSASTCSLNHPHCTTKSLGFRPRWRQSC